MIIPEVHLQRTKKKPPSLTIWGVSLRDGVLTGGPYFVPAPIRPRTRLIYEGVKYEIPRLERGFYMLAIELKAVS